MRRPVMLTAAAMFALAVTGCSPAVTACPAIGWLNQITVRVEGAPSRVTSVIVCVDDQCPTWPDPVGPPPGASTAPAQQGGQSVPEPSPPTPPPLGIQPYIGSETAPGSWTVLTDMSTPSSVTVKAFSPAGDLVERLPTQLSWQRVGGTPECGGPQQAGPIILNVAP